MPRSALSNFLAKVVRGAPFSVQPAQSSGIGRTRLPDASTLFAERIKTRKGGDRMGRGGGFHSLSREVARTPPTPFSPVECVDIYLSWFYSPWIEIRELEIRRKLEEKEAWIWTGYHFYRWKWNWDEWNEIWKLIYFRFYRSRIFAVCRFYLHAEINWKGQVLLRLYESVSRRDKRVDQAVYIKFNSNCSTGSPIKIKIKASSCSFIRKEGKGFCRTFCLKCYAIIIMYQIL